MKYKVGDRVKVHTKEWFDNTCDRNDFFNTYGSTSSKGSNSFVPDMQKFCGQIVTIKHIRALDKAYLIQEDSEFYNWEDWMFEDMNNNTNTIFNPNIVEDFAKLIGVELDEEFYDSKGGWRYKFTADSGLMVYDNAVEDWRVAFSYALTAFFKMIKEGNFVKKWTPKNGDRVYFPVVVSDTLYLDTIYHKNNAFDKEMLEKGLYFRTQEEAIECAKQMIENRRN